jgi:dTDP-4-dehydrorhamnose 3,5-epimerase
MIDLQHAIILNQNVIRGMHFQLHHFEHEKVVYVTDGKILDVILDLRKNSKTMEIMFP